MEKSKYNMEKICLINQPAGIGDVFFLQKVCHFYISKGYVVYYPLLPELMFIKNYIKVENLNFVSINDDFPQKKFFTKNSPIFTEELVFLPLRIADLYFPNISCMEAKYKMVNINFDDWDKYFSFERNIESENSLYYDILNLKDDEKYFLVSNKWGTPPNTNYKDIFFDNSMKIVNIDLIEGFTIFDWCKVIENAEGISIVDTAFNYIIDKLNLKTEKLYLTSRFTPANFTHIINLFKKNWILLN